jgi:hypothetical protein
MSAQLPLGSFSSIAIAFLTPTELTLFKGHATSGSDSRFPISHTLEDLAKGVSSVEVVCKSLCKTLFHESPHDH